MTDTPTDKKLSERFRELVALNEADSLNELIDGHADAILSALRLAESHPSAIREAVEGEREACAKLADGQADAIKIPRDENGNVDRHDEFTKQLVAMKVVARDIAAALRARGEEKGQ